MLYQTDVPNWPTALLKMPDGALVESVNDPAILSEAVRHWMAAGRDASQLWTAYRHMDFDYTFSTDWEQMLAKWRMNFRRFVDATYLKNYAPYVKLVLELNEYTDTRMVTDQSLLLPRLTSAQAAVHIWNTEYRGKTIVVDGTEGTIPDDTRLVINNNPVGNDIPKEFYHLAVTEDAVLGTHTYTRWLNKQRDPEDFRYHSGRWNYNEEEYGIKPVYAFTESGPYLGVLEGWRHENVLGGDRDLLIEAMRLWIRDLQGTSAYNEGRILGPGAWFTSSRLSDQWGYYRLWDSELIPLAEMCAQEWHPGVAPPKPDPDPDPECRGKPREQYRRVYNVIAEDATTKRAVEIFTERWEAGRETAGGAYDDAGVGDLDIRVARLHDLPQDRHQEFIDWYEEHYPGVQVELWNETAAPDFKIIDIVGELSSYAAATYQFVDRPIEAITALTIHHTVSGTDRADITAINGYHQSTNDWERIGYHYCITNTGEVYQVNHLTTKSFHAGSIYAPGDENYWSVGIALLGNFSRLHPPQIQQDAAQWLVEYLRDSLGSLEGVGHRDMPGGRTQCPGDTYKEWIDYIIG